MVDTTSLASVQTSELGAAIVASIVEQMAAGGGGPTQGTTTYAVTLREESALVIDADGYGLTGADGQRNATAVAELEHTLSTAACVGLVGTCTATVANERRRLSGRRLSGTDVSLAREFDFGASTDVSSSASDLLTSAGVGVTSAVTTGLSASTSVTVIGQGAAATSPLADALDTQALGTALTARLPSVSLNVESRIITPPALPPSPPTIPPSPPLVPPPSPPIQPPAVEDALFRFVVPALAVGLSTVLVAAIALYRQANRRLASKSSARVLPQPGTAAVNAPAYLLTEVPAPPKTPDHMLFSPRASFSPRGASVRYEQPVNVEELHGEEQQ